MYNSLKIAESIKDVAKNSNIKLSVMCADLGIGINTFSNMKTSFPKSDTLARIADYLGCSVDYLLGRPADGITAEERQLLELFRACSDDDKKYIRRLASTFAAEEVAEKAKRAE